MQSIIIISAILACGAAAPAYLLSEPTHVIHSVPLTKSTYTQSSQVVDHGSTHVLHPVTAIHSIPVVHAKTTITKADHVVSHGGSYVHPVHSYVMPVHEVYHYPKTTITKSNQVVNHGGTHLVHAPVVSVAHAPVVYHSSPLVTLKTGDSAVTHHSSTVHETVPVVKSALVAVHH
uniref:Cuticle protein n=1 Tax=Heliothis virescens TaxID=7102 RepID=A0A2A4JT38_HELVI